MTVIFVLCSSSRTAVATIRISLNQSASVETTGATGALEQTNQKQWVGSLRQSAAVVPPSKQPSQLTHCRKAWKFRGLARTG
jgi:hypothetical protein